MKIKKFFKDVKKGQKEFGDDIAAIINAVLLSLVYVFGVGLSFVIARLSKKKLLDKDVEKQRESYWEELNISNGKMEDYYRQF